MKILIFGNIGSGKTTLAQKLSTLLRFDYVSIDNFRRNFSDGTWEGEFTARELFIEEIEPNATNQIIELTGFGELGELIHEKLQHSSITKIVIVLECDVETCSERIKSRTWNIPYPVSLDFIPETINKLNEMITSDLLFDRWSDSAKTEYLKLNSNNSIDIENIINLINCLDMKKEDVINQIKIITENEIACLALLQIGSYGRGTQTPNSDVDLQLLINPASFNLTTFVTKLKDVLGLNLKYHWYLEDYQKIVLYMTDKLFQVEIVICKEMSEIDKLFLGSEIENIQNAILVDKTNTLNQYLIDIYKAKLQTNTVECKQKTITDLIYKFMYQFSNCSESQRRSDGYKFYFQYNLALHTLIKLDCIADEKWNFLYLPQNYIYKYARKEFEKYCPTVYLPDSNKFKRNLLNLFYTVLPKLQTVYNLEINTNQITSFLEDVYNRDQLWNFRDISEHNPRIKTNLIFRASALSKIDKIEVFQSVMNQYNIKTIIDLRADREVQQMPYMLGYLDNTNYVRAPFDPWNQPPEFKIKNEYGKPEAQAYRYFAMECKESVKAIVDVIIENYELGSILIHCYAGRDRTGIVVSLLHLLTDSDMKTIMTDYKASEMSIEPTLLLEVLEFIDSKGGIEPYLNYCNIENERIEKLKTILKR